MCWRWLSASIQPSRKTTPVTARGTLVLEALVTQVQEVGHTTVRVGRLIQVRVGLAPLVQVALDIPGLAVPHTTALAVPFIEALAVPLPNRLAVLLIRDLVDLAMPVQAGRATRGRVEQGNGVLRSANERRAAMRLVLTLLLSLAAAPAWAEWVKVTVSDIGTTYYVDSATLRKEGFFRRAWVIQNLKQRGDGGQRSQRTLWEFDCKEARDRLLTISAHSEWMAGGNVLLTIDHPGKWNHVPPVTAAEDLLNFVCAK